MHLLTEFVSVARWVKALEPEKLDKCLESSVIFSACKTMTLESSVQRPNDYHAKKARAARHKRLENKRKIENYISQKDENWAKKARFCVREVVPESVENNSELEIGSCSSSISDVEESNARLRYDAVSLIGRRRVMEDAVTVAPEVGAGEFEFFGVYDGHGGSTVANACRDRLHLLLEKEIEARRSYSQLTCTEQVKDEKELDEFGDEISTNIDIDWEEVMAACFSKMDEEISGKGGGEGAEQEMAGRTMGSTAVAVVVGKEEVVVANCGDCRVVLCRSGEALPLSDDHKPDRADEKERVEAAGGKIINWNGCRVLGVLSTSRSIGDHYLRPYVISKPEVTINRRTDSDEFLIIASDGLWDVISNDFACEIVGKCLDGSRRRKVSGRNGAAEAVSKLAEVAIAKGSADNISVIVVELKKRK